MMNLLDRFFSNRPSGSKDDAKKRLQFLLMHDQVDLSESQMEAMKAELVAVIARYAEVDAERIDVRLERTDNQVRLTSSVPVRRVTSRPATV